MIKHTKGLEFLGRKNRILDKKVFIFGSITLQIVLLTLAWSKKSNSVSIFEALWEVGQKIDQTHKWT